MGAVYALVFIGFLLAHIFIFRDVIAAIPAILEGKTVIVREELVPFFSFSSQFMSEGTSALTSSDEVRVAYSFWTAWVRHYAILPFALVIVNALSAFILFYAFHRIARYFVKHSLFGVVAAILAALLIHTILLYAKIAHFYVLIIGFSMFALATTLMCEQIFMKRHLQKRNILAVSLLVLLNPAIHYHVIFYLLSALIIGLHLFFTFMMNRPYFWDYLRKDILYLLVVGILSAVPYGLLIMAATATSFSSVSTQIPVNYWMIYYASLGLPFIFSLDTAGHLDLIRYGNYLAPIPRIGTTIVIFLIGWIFLFREWARLHLARRVFIISLFISLLLAMWMSIGYSPNTPLSFHSALGGVALFFAEQSNTVSQVISKVISLFINVLRFPHRFQFIYFYMAGVLFMLALIWLRDAWSRKMHRPLLAGVLVVLVALFPILGSADYRTVLASGDAATFAAPYPIPDDLKHIKQKMAAETGDTKLFILPTLESGREIKQGGQSFSFLDKFLIYYLNEPTLYYGVGANTDNKIMSYLVYRAIAYNEPWWEDILVNNLGITHILVPERIQQREYGITYLPGIEQKVQTALAKSQKFQKVYSGQDYTLYKAATERPTTTPVLADLEWDTLLEYLNNDSHAEEPLYFPLQLKKFLERPGDKYLMSDSLERSFYNLYTQRAKQLTFLPDPSMLPFQKELIASSNFTNNALSLSTLYSKKDAYNYLHEIIPSLVSLRTPQFIGLTKGNAEMDIKLQVPADGTYRILVHGASRANTVDAVVGGLRLPLKKIKDDQGKHNDHLDFTYFYADVELLKGKQTIGIRNTSQNAVLVESLTLVPKKDVPRSFDAGKVIDHAGIRMQTTDKKDIYEVHVKEGS